MITKIQSYRTTDGDVTETLEEARAAEITRLLMTELKDQAPIEMGRWVVKHATKIIEILTATPKSAAPGKKRGPRVGTAKTKTPEETAAARTARVALKDAEKAKVEPALPGM